LLLPPIKVVPSATTVPVVVAAMCGGGGGGGEKEQQESKLLEATAAPTPTSSQQQQQQHEESAATPPKSQQQQGQHATMPTTTTTTTTLDAAKTTKTLLPRRRRQEESSNKLRIAKALERSSVPRPSIPTVNRNRQRSGVLGGSSNGVTGTDDNVQLGIRNNDPHLLKQSSSASLPSSVEQKKCISSSSSSSSSHLPPKKMSMGSSFSTNSNGGGGGGGVRVAVSGGPQQQQQQQQQQQRRSTNASALDGAGDPDIEHRMGLLRHRHRKGRKGQPHEGDGGIVGTEDDELGAAIEGPVGSLVVAPTISYRSRPNPHASLLHRKTTPSTSEDRSRHSLSPLLLSPHRQIERHHPLFANKEEEVRFNRTLSKAEQIMVESMIQGRILVQQQQQKQKKARQQQQPQPHRHDGELLLATAEEKPQQGEESRLLLMPPPPPHPHTVGDGWMVWTPQRRDLLVPFVYRSSDEYNAAMATVTAMTNTSSGSFIVSNNNDTTAPQQGGRQGPYPMAAFASSSARSKNVHSTAGSVADRAALLAIAQEAPYQTPAPVPPLSPAGELQQLPPLPDALQSSSIDYAQVKTGTGVGVTAGYFPMRRGHGGWGNAGVKHAVVGNTPLAHELTAAAAASEHQIQHHHHHRQLTTQSMVVMPSAEGETKDRLDSRIGGLRQSKEFHFVYS